MIVKTYEEMFDKPLTIRDLSDGFTEDTKSGKVTAFDGKLNVRPPYQREFVYSPDKQKAVINTVMSGYPLNVMYWAKNGDEFELMDGQQRTISFCKFVSDQFSVPVTIAGREEAKTFSDLDEDTQKEIFDYPLTVYICDGDENEKISWFRIINIAGVQLTEQEMRNAIYNGTWVTDAKRYFSKVDCVAIISDGRVTNNHIYGDYLAVANSSSEKKDSVMRQALLEKVLHWATDAYNRDNGLKLDIDEFMRVHRYDQDATVLWRYYEDVMEWVKKTFPTYHKEMKSVEWGLLYNRYKDSVPVDADQKVEYVFNFNKQDPGHFSNISGVYEFVLSGDRKYLSERAFNEKDKVWAYNKQKGICPYCHKHFDSKDMHGDHKKPWSKGGTTERDNLQMLCAECNIKKSNYDSGFDPWDNKAYAEFNLDKWDQKS